ncbi:MAG: SH3 domain-containing protein [Cyclobacteriaceae bacterium]
MIRILTLLLIPTLFSCDSKRIEGVYFYTEIPKERNDDESLFSGAFEMGREIGCAVIGKFEFRDGKCYFSTMGIDQRADYEIDNGVIYLGSNKLTNGGIGIRIIDANTISYSGCIFKKIDFNKIKLTTTNASSNLRSGPGEDYKKLETLKKGTELYVLDDTKVWIKVRVNRKEGYLHKDYLGPKERQPESKVSLQSTKTNKLNNKVRLKETLPEKVEKIGKKVLDTESIYEKNAFGQPALYGKSGISGWKIGEVKIPVLPDDESGRIIFELKVSDVGEIIEIKTVESSISQEAEDLIRNALREQVLTKTKTSVPSISTGKITFVINNK